MSSYLRKVPLSRRCALIVRVRLDEAGLADVVLELLAPHGVTDDPLELGVRGALAQRPTQVGLVQREQACAEPPVGSETDAVAVTAERLGYRIDEADPAAAVSKAVDA